MKVTNTASAFAAIALSLVAGAAIAAAPGRAPARPYVGAYDAARVTRLCDEGIARSRATLARMEAGKGRAGFLGEWNRAQIEIEDVVNPIYLMGSVHPDKSVRDAADPCLAKYTTLSTEIFQSEKLFARVKATKAANPRQAKLREVLALDMLPKFSGNLLDPKVGRFYRDTILAQGGQVEPADMVRKFLGREPSSEAFFREITGQR